MNKKELAKIYSKISKNMINVKRAIEEIDVFLETVQEALLVDGKVKFIKRGTFEVLKKKARIISNPSTRELMKIYPKKTIKFKISKELIKQLKVLIEEGFSYYQHFFNIKFVRGLSIFKILFSF